jgi:hypothetical protein
VKDENGDLLPYSYNILMGESTTFYSVLNVHRVRDVMQRRIDTAEPLAPDPRPFEVEIDIFSLR